MLTLMIILGLLFGSLGSVILTRFDDDVTRTKLRGFFFGFSKCPHCGHRLRAKNLIPLISYFFQGGKCRYCGAKISWIYPVLEILSAGIFVGTYIRLQNFGIGYIAFWIITNRLLLLLLLHDIQKYELHMSTRALLLTTGVVGNILLPDGNLWSALFASIFFVGMFLLIYFFAKRYVKIRFKTQQEGFGIGDIYLSLIVGIYLPIVLGYQKILFSGSMIIKILIVFVLLSSIIGLFRAGIQFLLGKLFGNTTTAKKIQTTISPLKIIPFFPAMIIAFWLLAWKSQFFITLLFR